MRQITLFVVVALLVAIAAGAIDESVQSTKTIPLGADATGSTTRSRTVTSPAGTMGPGVDTLAYNGGYWEPVLPDGGSKVASWYIEIDNDSTATPHTALVRLISNVPDTIVYAAVGVISISQNPDSTENIASIELQNPWPTGYMHYWKAITTK